MDWQKRLDIFLADFEHHADVIGVLVCGSYITGNPSNHSDLDVHIVLDESVDYRERGNKIIDGLLIEYFANPPRQILRYFDEDLVEKDLMCQVQFATGEIIFDEKGVIAELKEKAIRMIDEFYQKNSAPVLPELTKCFMWDMLDDLQDALETGRADFDFLYFTSLDWLMKSYMGAVNRPYGRKAILGNIESEIVRGKYLLKELPDETVAGLISKAMRAVDKGEKLAVYQQLTEAVWARFGGFNIDGFSFGSAVEE